MINESMRDAFRQGFTDPNAPLSAGEQRLLYRAGPRIVFVEEEPQTIQMGEISHSPCLDKDDIEEFVIIED